MLAKREPARFKTHSTLFRGGRMPRSPPIRAYHLYLPRAYCDAESHAVGVAGCSSRPTNRQGWLQYLRAAVNSNQNEQAKRPSIEKTGTAGRQPDRQFLCNPHARPPIALCNHRPSTCEHAHRAGQIMSSQLRRTIMGSGSDALSSQSLREHNMERTITLVGSLIVVL